MGQGKYPKTLMEYYELMINWKRYSKGFRVENNDGTAFTSEL